MSTADGSEPVAELAGPRSLWTTASPAEAIQLALSQSKLFLVWIPPSSEEVSSAWDPVWADTAVHSFLSQYAVAITLAQDSVDAAMFLQLVRSEPSAVGVWIVFAGRMLDSFAGPPSPQEMLLRIQNALSSSQAPLAAPADSLPSQDPQTQSTSHTVASTSDVSTPSAPAASSSQPSQPYTQTESSQPDSVREQLAARRARLEAEKAQQGPLHQSPLSDIQKKTNEKPAAQQQQNKPRQPTQSAKNTSPSKPKNERNNAQKEQKSSKKSSTTRKNVGVPKHVNKMSRHRKTALRARRNHGPRR
jgi:hypothetical protein